MGCDIHLYVEKKNNGIWEPVIGKNHWIDEYKDWYANSKDEKYRANLLKSIEKMEKEEPEVYCGWLYDGRNYTLFGILADVRNGICSFFRGPSTGQEAKPISMPKGLPEDVSSYVKLQSDEWDCDGHSHSWFTLQELLDYDWNSGIKHVGLVGKEEYKEFKNSGSPNSWCGGSSATLISNQEMEDWIDDKIKFDEEKFIQTLIEWYTPAKDSAGSFYTDSIEKLKQLGDPEDVRIVFWFDN
jgi:hypothetical protein